MKLFRLLLVVVLVLCLAADSFAGPIRNFFQHRAQVRQQRIQSGRGLPVLRQFTLFGAPVQQSGCTNCGCASTPSTAVVPKEMPKKK